MRALLSIHRYLGFACGGLLLLWSASGVVMMYVSYPKLAESRRLQALTPIDWRECRRAPLTLPNDGSRPMRIEMLDRHPVLSQSAASGSPLFALESGASRGKVTVEEAAAVAAAFAPGSRGRLAPAATIELDQWTVSSQFEPDRPLYHFALGDPDGSELYVSSVTGRLVQATTRRQRFWNWLGPIPHWLYWVELRRHARDWTRVIVAGALLGGLLTLTGLWLGLRRLPRSASGRVTDARDWHHWSGLIFGLFTLTWLGSGLLTVQPWGLLESTAMPHAALRGPAPSASRVEQAIRQLEIALEGSRFVSVEVTQLAGEPYFLASTADGRRQRFDASGRPAPLIERDFSELARRLGSRRPAERLSQVDRDLLATGQQVALPVYRVLLDGPQQRAFYLDATSGALVARVDRNARLLGWIEGLHRFDCLRLLRGRPLGDVLVLILLAGVGVLCGTGIYLGSKRLFIGQR